MFATITMILRMKYMEETTNHKITNGANGETGENIPTFYQ